MSRSIPEDSRVHFETKARLVILIYAVDLATVTMSWCVPLLSY